MRIVLSEMKLNVLMTSVAVLSAASGTLRAQTALWTNTFPVPADYVCSLSAPYSDVLPSRTYSVDDVGGSVWVAVVKPQGASSGFVRVFWLNRSGVAILTNDIIGFDTASTANRTRVDVVRLTTRELALQISNTSGVRILGIDPIVEGTNVLRRITKSGATFTLVDKPLSLNEVVLPETRAVADRLGFFTWEYIWDFGSNESVGITMRRYSNR